MVNLSIWPLQKFPTASDIARPSAARNNSGYERFSASPCPAVDGAQAAAQPGLRSCEIWEPRPSASSASGAADTVAS